MMPSTDTDGLIRNLSREAGLRRGLGRVGFGPLFAVTLALSLAASVGRILFWIGGPTDTSGLSILARAFDDRSGP